MLKKFILSFLIFLLFAQFNDLSILKGKEKETTKEKRNDNIQSNYGWEFLTYLGGNNNDGFITLTKDSNYIYIGGTISSSNFTFINKVYGRRGGSDYIILKLDFEMKLIWGVIIASSNEDYLFDIAIDSSGNIWGCGETSGSDFPTTLNAFQRTYKGGADGTIFALDPNGTLIYSTYFGGTAYEGLTNLVVNIDNTIWFTGRTRSTDFPITPNAKKGILVEEYNTPIIKFSNNGTLLYSSFFGGFTSGAWTLGDVIDATNDGKIIIAGYTNSNSLPISPNAFQKTKNISFDSFISVFDSTASIVWCTYFGGSKADYGSQLTIDRNNNIYLLHYTSSPDLPVKNSNLMGQFFGILDIFISVFDIDGNYLRGNYFGGEGYEGYDYSGLNYIGGSIKITNDNKLSCFFKTNSKTLPSLLDPPSADFDSYFLLLDSYLNLLFSTYIPGNGYDNAGDMIPLNDQSFIVCGATSSHDLNVVNPIHNINNGAFDGFIGLLKVHLYLDTIPPQFFSFSDSCGSVKTYFVKDSQQVNSGIASIKPIVLDNVNFFLVQKSDFSAKFVLNLLDKKRRGYFKIEVTDKSNNKLIIEDTLFEGISHLLQFSPSNILDFGMVNFNKTTARTIWLVNKTTDTIVLNKLSLRKNIDFSIPPSQLPIIIPPLDSFPLTIFFAPLKQKPETYFDTLDLNEECFFEKLILTGVIDTNKYSADSKCSVQVFGKSNFSAQFRTIKIHKLSKNEILIVNEEEKEDFKVQIYDYFGNLVYEGRSFENQLNVELPISSVYLLFIKTSNYSQKILFLIFDF